MFMKIWQHRISYEGECSYPLLEKGFWATGWSDIGDRDILDKIRSISDNAELHKIKTDNYPDGAGDIFCLQRFTQIAKGDWIVVPRPYEFGIYEALGEAIPVSERSV